MKKLYLPAVVIAAITLASCAKQEITADPTPIQFDTFVGKSAGVQTKGQKIGNNIVLLQKLGVGFYVQAYKTGADNWISYNHTTPSTGGDFMSNQLVKYASYKYEDEEGDEQTGYKLTYTPTQYWPRNNGKVTFFAYMGWMPPYSTEGFPAGMSNFTVPTGANAQPSFDFVVESDIVKQIDLLVATPVFDRSAGVGGVTEPVKFNFHHVLSNINFYARTADNVPDDTRVKITKLHLTFAQDQVRAGGTYTFAQSLNDDEPNEEEEEAKAPGEWSYPYDAYLALDQAVYDYAWGNATIINETNRLLMQNSNYHLLLLPQTIPAGAFNVKLEYTIKTGLVDGKDETPGARTINYTTELSLPKKELELKQGKQYNFNLTFDLGAVTIHAETGVSNWGDPEIKDSEH